MKNRAVEHNSASTATRKFTKKSTAQLPTQDERVFYNLPWQVHQISSSSSSVKMDLKMKISEKNRQKRLYC